MFQRLGINEALSPTAWNRTGLYWSSNFTHDATHDKVPKAWNLKNIPSLWTGGLKFLLWQTIKSKSFTLKFQNGSNGLEFPFKIPKGVRAPGTYSSKPLEWFLFCRACCFKKHCSANPTGRYQHLITMNISSGWMCERMFFVCDDTRKTVRNRCFSLIVAFENIISQIQPVDINIWSQWTYLAVGCAKWYICMRWQAKKGSSSMFFADCCFWKHYFANPTGRYQHLITINISSGRIYVITVCYAINSENVFVVDNFCCLMLK